MAETTKSSDAPKSAVAATLEQLKPQEAESKTLKIENTDKRDTLIAEEKKYQKSWRFQPGCPLTGRGAVRHHHPGPAS